MKVYDCRGVGNKKVLDYSSPKGELDAGYDCTSHEVWFRPEYGDLIKVALTLEELRFLAQFVEGVEEGAG